MSKLSDEIGENVPALRRYARALTHDRDWADDLVQDCIERALRKQSLWRPTGPVRAWLFRILLNLFRNELRGRKRSPKSVPIDALPSELSIPGHQFGHVALMELARAIDRLPADQREALLLVTMEGFGYADAAEVLEIPIGTLMSRLGRARSAIRQATHEDGLKLRAVKP